MKCPVKFVRDLSAEGGFGVKLSAGRRQDGEIPGRRLGAGDESSRGYIAGDGEEDHLVAGGGDPGDFQSQHAALAALPGARLRRAAGSAEGHALRASRRVNSRALQPESAAGWGLTSGALRARSVSTPKAGT